MLSRVDGKGLDKGQVNTEQFFLRRSTGFATAFSSILRSQPNSTRADSMTKAMLRLFGAAKADEAPDANNWRRRVHALNVLKMVFEDAWLSTDLQPHASDAMQLAIDGFRSSSWAVRNSSMMLFSATVRATVGKRREKDDRSRRNRLTGDQFFGRFPALYTYFEKELKDASEYSARTSGLIDAADDMHPTLSNLAGADTFGTKSKWAWKFESYIIRPEYIHPISKEVRKTPTAQGPGDVCNCPWSDIILRVCSRNIVNSD